MVCEKLIDSNDEDKDSDYESPIESDLKSGYNIPPTNSKRRRYRMSVYNQDNRRISSQTK